MQSILLAERLMVFGHITVVCIGRLGIEFAIGAILTVSGYLRCRHKIKKLKQTHSLRTKCHYSARYDNFASNKIRPAETCRIGRELLTMTHIDGQAHSEILQKPNSLRHVELYQLKLAFHVDTCCGWRSNDAA